MTNKPGRAKVTPQLPNAGAHTPHAVRDTGTYARYFEHIPNANQDHHQGKQPSSSSPLDYSIAVSLTDTAS